MLFSDMVSEDNRKSQVSFLLAFIACAKCNFLCAPIKMSSCGKQVAGWQEDSAHGELHEGCLGVQCDSDGFFDPNLKFGGISTVWCQCD